MGRNLNTSARAADPIINLHRSITDVQEGTFRLRVPLQYKKKGKARRERMRAIKG
jgi:hypothetical protein